MKPIGSETLTERLARLRRQMPTPEPGPAPTANPTANPAAAKPTTPLPAWMQRRLAQQLTNVPRPLTSTQVAKTAGLPSRLESDPQGNFHFRASLFPLDYRHGTLSLQQTLGLSMQTIALLTGDPALAELDPSRAVFLDTETTGLSGGAGTFVYMVGLARFVPDGFEVWQGFLHGPENEPALLATVRDRIAQSGGVVSFFGKSFDRHRLEDKMKLHGIPPPFAQLPHLDLYHPLRRLHQGTLADARLQTMERTLCGVVRPDDLPGSLAPEAWFDFVAGRAHRLEGVFRHNLDDVLSLVTLTAWLATVEQRPWEASDPIEWRREQTLVAAWSKAGAWQVGLDRLCRAQLERPSPREIWLQRAELEERLGASREAIASLELGFPEPSADPLGLQALALGAKIYERRLQDAPRALLCCERALELLGAMRHFAGRTSLEAELRKRAARLRRTEAPMSDPKA